MFKVAIAGSKDFKNYELLCQFVDLKLSRIAQEDTIEIVTGFAKSTVDMATQYAQEHGYSHTHFQPDPANYYSLAYQRVSDQMITYADCIIVFWDDSNGAASTLITKARKAEARIAVKRVEQPLPEPPLPWPQNLLKDAEIEISQRADIEKRLELVFDKIKLRENVQKAIYYRYRDGLCLQAAGDKMYITGERVRQLVKKGLQTLLRRREDVISILETGQYTRLRDEVKIADTSMSKSYVEQLKNLGIETIGDLRATPDYQSLANDETITVDRRWITSNNLPIAPLKWLLRQEEK